MASARWALCRMGSPTGQRLRSLPTVFEQRYVEPNTGGRASERRRESFAGGFVDQVIHSDRPFLFGLRQSGAFALLMMIIPGLACALLAGLMVLVLAGAIKLGPDTAGYVIVLGLSEGALVGIYTMFIAPLVGTAVIVYPLMAMVITVLVDRVFSWCRQKSAKRRSPSPA